MSINACTHPGDHESENLWHIQIYGCTCTAHINIHSFMPLHLCGAWFTFYCLGTEPVPWSHQASRHLQRASLKLSDCISWQTALWSERTHLPTTWSIQVTLEQIENEMELKQSELIQTQETELIAGASHHCCKMIWERIHSLMVFCPINSCSVSQWDENSIPADRG